MVESATGAGYRGATTILPSTSITTNFGLTAELEATGVEGVAFFVM
jgi:hypothetical protein